MSISKLRGIKISASDPQTGNDRENKDNDKNHDLSDQIKVLQQAVAHERGENQKFRDEVRALLRRRQWNR